MGNIFNDDFREFIEALNVNRVKYVLVGGYSVIYHGFPRTTGDLDIFVEVSLQNYQLLKKAFDHFKMPVFDMTEDNFLYNKDLTVFTFGRSPIAIEILKEISGLDFDNVYAKSADVNFEGLQIKIINLRDLKTNKKASGRPKDINDLDNLPN